MASLESSILVGGVSVAVVGGGIGGLLSSIEIAKLGFNVIVYEEHGAVGLPKHCTGLISETTLSEIIRSSGINHKNIIKAKFNEYAVMLLTPNKLSMAFNIKFNEYVYLIDRVMTEQLIAQRAEDLGVNIKLKTIVSDVLIDRSGMYLIKYIVSRNVKSKMFTHVIIAEGAKRTLSSRLKLCKSIRNCYGIQALIKFSNQHYFSTPLIIVGSLSKHYFGWMVPVNDDELLVGIMDSNSPIKIYRSLTMFIKKYLREFINNKDLKVREYFGGLIPCDMRCILGVRNLCSVGDASSLVKPFTGGGIYVITRQAKALTEALRKYQDDVATMYSIKLIPLIKILKRDLIVKKLIDTVGGYRIIVRFLSNFIDTLKVKNYDDMLSSLLRGFSIFT